MNGDAEQEAKGQLELFGALLVDLSEQKQDEALHQVTGRDGRRYEGSWDDIVAQMRDASAQPAKSVLEFMQSEARRGPVADGHSHLHRRRGEFRPRQRGRRPAAHSGLTGSCDNSIRFSDPRTGP